MPAIGAGTANSEFEVLTGFNVAYFGAGEYPYKTILGKQTIESMATQLKLDGYSTHAMHNHDGTFYDRYKVYKNMGFDIKDYPNAYEMFANEITLPLHTKLSDDDVAYVLECLEEVLHESL